MDSPQAKAVQQERSGERDTIMSQGMRILKVFFVVASFSLGSLLVSRLHRMTDNFIGWLRFPKTITELNPYRMNSFSSSWSLTILMVFIDVDHRPVWKEFHLIHGASAFDWFSEEGIHSRSVLMVSLWYHIQYDERQD